MFKIGNGFDVHKFEKGKPLVLGGIRIDYDYGLKAHSDGDVVIHSVIDSILGACGLGDIGDHFPDSNSKYRNICSEELLKTIIQKISTNYELKNLDVTIICEKPNLSKYKVSIKKNLANLCGINDNHVNIKATTMEKMGDIGKGKGIAVLSTCLIENRN